MIVVASPGGLPLTHTLVKNEPFTAEEVAKVEAFAEREGFELWQRPDRRVASLVSKILRWPPRQLEQFYASHPLKLGPTTDDSPFFFNFYKWRTLAQPATYTQLGYDRTLATGQIVLVIMLVQAVVMSALLILLPLRRVPRATGGTLLQRGALLLYFAALGTGFILLEISLIQRFVLFLGYPTYSLTVVMLSLLVSTGIGSLLTERVNSRFELAPAAAARWAWRCSRACSCTGRPLVFAQLLGAPLALRIAVSIALLVPLGLVLGGFFPLGIRIAERANPRLVPWAWAVNGCATVIGTLVAVIAGMSSSFTTVTLPRGRRLRRGRARAADLRARCQGPGRGLTPAARKPAMRLRVSFGTPSGPTCTRSAKSLSAKGSKASSGRKRDAELVVQSAHEREELSPQLGLVEIGRRGVERAFDDRDAHAGGAQHLDRAADQRLLHGDVRSARRLADRPGLHAARERADRRREQVEGAAPGRLGHDAARAAPKGDRAEWIASLAAAEARVEIGTRAGARARPCVRIGR